MIDQEFKQVFSPSARVVNIGRMEQEVDYLQRIGKKQLAEFINNEKYEESAAMQQALTELEAIQGKLAELSADDVTDVKYQLDDQKRKLAQVIDNKGKADKILLQKEEYYYAKERCLYFLKQANNAELLKRFETLQAEESEWMSNCSTQFIRWKTDEMNRLNWNIRKKDLEHMTDLYLYYAVKPNEAYNNISQIKILKKRGDEALARQNVDEIVSIIYKMYDLLIDKNKEEEIKGTGLRG